jgi:hypothetical protein
MNDGRTLVDRAKDTIELKSRAMLTLALRKKTFAIIADGS